MSICGLDFGTSNTTLGTIAGRGPVLTVLEAGQTTIPSAIFYEVEGLAGRKATQAYGGGGRGGRPPGPKPEPGPPHRPDRPNRPQAGQVDQLQRL